MAEPPIVVWPERLNPTDATLWDIERQPSLRTTIVAVLRLVAPVDDIVLLEAFESASRLLPRLRSRIVEMPGGVGTPYWVLNPDFDVADHVGFIGVDGDLDTVIGEVAAEMASTPFQRSGSLWEVAVLEAESGPSALLLKVHHSLTDGVGGVELLDAMLDSSPDAPQRVLSTPVAAGVVESVMGDVVTSTGRALRSTGKLSRAALSALVHPQRAASNIARTAWSSAKLLAPSGGAESGLLAGRSELRAVGMCELELDRLHQAAHRQHCTVNDVFFAGVVGGVAAYHRALDHQLEHLRVVMPVSLRRDNDDAGGNQWAPARFVVPADVDDPIERMHAMRALVQSHRREPSLGFSRPLAAGLQTLPSMLSSAVVGSMMQGVDVVLTNVPGPVEPRYLAGVLVDRLWAFAPTAGAALNAALVSHGEVACVGTLTDTAATDDHALLTELIEQELSNVIIAAESAEPRPSIAASAPGAKTASVDRLSALDTGFLRLESEETPMHVGGLAILDGDGLRGDDGTLRLDEIRDHVAQRLPHLPRFRTKLAEVPLGIGRPVWVDDDDFDIANHVLAVDVDAPGHRQDVLDLAARLIAEPLDRSRPLWQLYLVDGLDNGNVGLVEIVHHSLVDGMTGVELAVALFDLDAVPHVSEPAEHTPRPDPGSARRFTDALIEQWVGPVTASQNVAAVLRSDPAQVREGASDALRSARELLRPRTLVRFASFNRNVSAGRSLHTAVLAFDHVQHVAHELDATLNDVVLSLVSGALRHWMQVHHETLFDVHALVPVSRRSGGMADEPGNRVGALLVSLPVAEPDPGRRIALVRDRTDRLKAAHVAEGVGTLIDGLDHLPAPWTGVASRLAASQHAANLVVTNVRGPRQRLFFMGSRIEEIVPVVPLGPHLGLGVAVLSYADRVTISLSADPELCRDMELFTSRIAEELRVLTELCPET